MKANETKRHKLAVELHVKLRGARKSLRAAWYQFALIAARFEDEELYREIGFGSMKAYLKSLDDSGYSTIAEGIAAVKVARKAGIKSSELPLYSKENLKVLGNVAESKMKNEAILKAAREMKTSDFRAYVNKKANTALEDKTRYIIDCAPSQVIVFDGAVAKMQEIAAANGEDGFSRADAFEYLCVAFLQKTQDVKPEDVKLAKRRAINLKGA